MFGRSFVPRGRSVEKNSMSIEKSEKSPMITLTTSNPQALQKNMESLHTAYNGNGALIEQRFAFNLKEQDPLETVLPGILLKFTIPAYAGERKRFLKIRKAQINYVNYFDDTYPCHYSICTSEVGGILDKEGVTTKQLVTIPLQQISTNISNDFMTLNLLYQTEDRDEYLVDITGIPSLTFYLLEEMGTQPVPTPLASHLLLEVSIYRSLV